MDSFEFEENNVLFADIAEHSPDREVTVNAEHKCTTCGSTNLIAISDYSKAILFLGNTVDNSGPNKKRSRRHGRKDCLDKKWCCLDCKNVW